MEKEGLQKVEREGMPKWLAKRQLNNRLLDCAFLPEGIDTDKLVDIIDEENDYEGPYSPDLLALLNSVDQAFVFFHMHDPVFCREIFESWYFKTFAPAIFDRKLPAMPPPLHADAGHSNLFLALMILTVIGLAFFLLDAAFGHKVAQWIGRHLYILNPTP